MPGLTAKDHILWTQRIRKEEAVNCKSLGTFSLRYAVTEEGVPRKFKPGHLNPARDRIKDGHFDTAELGWQPNDAFTKEFRRCINRQRVGPRERHQFPETGYQELGWPQAQSGPAAERSQPAGSNPSKLGIGWLQKDGHGGPTTKLAAESAVKPEFQARLDRVLTDETRPRARMFRDGNVRESLGVPPFACSTGGAVGRAQRAQGAAAGAAGAGAASVAASSSSKPSRTTSLPALGAAASGPDEALTSQEEVVAQAMDHSRLFLNRHQKNQWYHPLTQSDVCLFANAYTLAFGKCVFHK